MNINNTIFMTVPIEVDYDLLQLTKTEDKQKFVDMFIKEAIHIPITYTIPRLDDDHNPTVEEIVIGTVTEGKATNDYNINLFVMGIADVGVQFIQEPTTENNMNEPIGNRVKPCSINLQYDGDVNKIHFDIVQKQREIADMIKRKVED
jgi:hypothetical protein